MAGPVYNVTMSECVILPNKPGPSGYVNIWRDGKTHLAHRLAWQEVHGPILGALVIDHLCRNRACVNVEHMELVTRAENTRRGNRYRWPEGTCIRGHDWSEHGYTVPSRPTKRRCRACEHLLSKQRPTTVAGRALKAGHQTPIAIQ